MKILWARMFRWQLYDLRICVSAQLYMECHYLAHSNLIDSIIEDSCRQLCRAVAPHVKQFYYWVGAETFPLH